MTTLVAVLLAVLTSFLFGYQIKSQEQERLKQRMEKYKTIVQRITGYDDKRYAYFVLLTKMNRQEEASRMKARAERCHQRHPPPWAD